MLRMPMTQEMIGLTRVAERLVNDSPFGHPLRALRALHDLSKPPVRVELPVSAHVSVREVTIVAAVPGLGPEDLAITWDDQFIVLRGTLPDRLPADGAMRAATGRGAATGPFEQAIPLPATVNPDQAVATVERGLLTLRLPRTDSAAGRRIAVQSA